MVMTISFVQLLNYRVIIITKNELCEEKIKLTFFSSYLKVGKSHEEEIKQVNIITNSSAAPPHFSVMFGMSQIC
jgi:patatin-like phospholipase/acyl hydrolase